MLTTTRYGLLSLLLGLLCLLAAPARAQSRRLRRLQAALAQQRQPSRAREHALWALAWEKEVPPARQDSLAAQATELAEQLCDSVGQLSGQVARARTALAAGRREAAQALLQPTLSWATRHHNVWLQVLALIQLGRTYWGTADHTLAQGYWQQAWAAAQRQPDVYWRVRTAMLQANFTTNYAQGLNWYLRALELARQADCQACQAEILGSIGYNYVMLGELGQAQHYATQALLQQQQVRNREGEKLALIILAGLHTQQGHYPAALAAYRQAARLTHTLTDSLTIASGRADIYAARGQYALAGTQARRGLALAGQLGNRDFRTLLEATLADCYLQQGQRDSALVYGRLSYVHRQPGGGHLLTARSCRVLAQAYAARHDFARAYLFEQRAEAYTDSLTSDKIRSQVAQARYNYELAQRQRRIAQLERDQALGQLRRQRQLAAGGLGALLLLGGAGGAVWTGRQRHRRRLAALRTRLATDLHDEVGALLLRVSLRSELLSTGGRPTVGRDADEPHLTALRADSRQALATLRDVVWSLDAGADTVGALLDRLREHLDQTAEPAGLQPVVTVAGLPEAQPLAPPLRQHLYLLAKEAITNAVRHAHQAQQLHLDLRRDGPSLLLTVTDDGQPRPASPAGRTGLGLRSMQQRAAAMAGQLMAGPCPGGEPGWRVQVRVPLA